MSASVHMVKLTAAALVLTAAFNLSGCNSQAAAPEAPRSALVAHPQSADTLHAEVYPGDVHARYESQLGFRVNGKIKARLVDVGAHVQAGQALAELDPMDLKLQAASAQATLSSARANRDLAQSEFDAAGDGRRGFEYLGRRAMPQLQAHPVSAHAQFILRWHIAEQPRFDKVLLWRPI